MIICEIYTVKNKRFIRTLHFIELPRIGELIQFNGSVYKIQEISHVFPVDTYESETHLFVERLDGMIDKVAKLL